LIEPIALVWLALIFLMVLFRSIGRTDFSSWQMLRLGRRWAVLKFLDLPQCDAVVVLCGGAEAS